MHVPYYFFLKQRFSYNVKMANKIHDTKKDVELLADKTPSDFQDQHELSINPDWEDENESIESDNSCLQYIEFESIRGEANLEVGIKFSWPKKKNGSDDNSEKLKEYQLSTLLEPDEIAPLFAGAQWAGTRVWDAAIRATQYLESNYGDEIMKGKSLCELGCGLGVPGMICHSLGANVILTDQECIMSQLHKNCHKTFPETYVDHQKIINWKLHNDEEVKKNHHVLLTHPLTWSRESLHKMLQQTGYTNGFDFLINCDCVFEPLYKKSWKLLIEVIDECLKINPDTVVITSCERRNADGIDNFILEMEQSENVQSVELVRPRDSKNIEIYLTKGKR